MKSTTIRIIIYSLLSILVLICIIYSMFFKVNVLDKKSRIFVEEKELLVQVKLNQALKLYIPKQSALTKTNANTAETVHNYPRLALRYAVLLDFIGQSSQALTILNNIKTDSDSPKVLPLIKTLLDSGPLLKENHFVKLIELEFHEQWYQLHLLRKFYQKSKNLAQLAHVDKKIKQSSIYFMIITTITSLFMISAFIIGLILLITWIKNWSTDMAITPSFIFSRVNYPALDGYGVFVIWLSFYFVINQLISYSIRHIPINAAIYVALFSYLIYSILGVYLFKVLILSQESFSLIDFIKKISNRFLSSAGLGSKAFLVAILVVIIVSLINNLLFPNVNNKWNPLIGYLLKEKSTVVLMTVLLMASVLAPLFEEFLFRGVLFRLFQKKWGFLTGAIISSILFGLAHMNPATFIPITVLGFIFAWIYQQSNSIIAPIVAHSIWNTFTLIAFLMKY